MEDIDLFSIDKQIRKEQLQEENSIKETIAIENNTINKNEVISEKETDEVVESDILSENTENTKNTEIKNMVQETQNQDEIVTVDKPSTEEINKDTLIIENKNTEVIQEDNIEANELPIIEEQEQAKEGEVINNPEVDKYINALRVCGSFYDVIPIFPGADKYSLCKISQDRESYYPLTNVLPVITKKLTYTNGADEENKYELVAYVLDEQDKKLGPIEITGKELTKLTSTLNNRFIGEVINYEANSDKRMREVVEIIGRKSVEEINTYTHTGFIEVNGNKHFLYQGGNIGLDEGIELRTDLTDYNIRQYSFTDKEFDLRTALETEHSLLELAELKIIVPLIATTFLSPLFSILQEEGIKLVEKTQKVYAEID